MSFLIIIAIMQLLRWPHLKYYKEKKCKSPTSCWDDISNGKHLRHDIIEKNIEKIKVTREHLLVA